MSDATKNYVRIPLTQGKFAIIDAADFEKVGHFKWHFSNDGYARRNESRKITGNKHVTLKMHRVLLDCPADMHVDHIDGNGLNNTRANIRIVTAKQNMWNRRVKSTSKTGSRGVTFAKGKYHVKIVKDSKELCLGSFLSLAEATEAYEKNAKVIHGEFFRSGIFTASELNGYEASRAPSSYPKKKYRYTTYVNGKWRAQLIYKGKSIHIGMFESRDDASMAAENKITELNSQC